MYGEIDITIPFQLLKRCERKYPDCTEHTRHGPNDDCKTYDDWIQHPETCMCNGSGVEPTSTGYEVLRMLKWAFRHAAWRLTDTSPCYTMERVVGITSRQSESDMERAKIERERAREQERRLLDKNDS